MIRATFRWLTILLGLAAVGGGAAAWYVWVRSDEMVRDELHARLAQIAPGCDLAIGRVRFDWDRTITVRDFAVRPKGKDTPATLVVPELVIHIDHDRFVKDQSVDVQVIKLVRPQLDLTRRIDGTWSVEDLAPFHLDPSIPVPEWQIEDATVCFRVEQENAEPVVLTLQDADLRLVPAGRRQLVIRGLSDVAEAGPLKVSGNLNLDPGHVTWSLSGSVDGLNTSGDIAGFALRSSASLRQQVANLGHKLQQAEEALLADDGTSDSPISPNAPLRTVSRDEATPPPWESRGDSAEVAANTATAAAQEAVPAEPCDLTGLGVNAVVDIKFAVGKSDPARPPTYQVTVDCRDGQVVNPLLPFGLQNLRGQLYWDNDSIRLTELRADGRGTSLRINGRFGLGGAEPTGSVHVAVTDLAVSDRYPGRLPAGIERFLQLVHPSGPVDVNATFGRDGAGGWTAQAFKLTAKGASAVPAPFQYPIRDITGVLELTAPGLLEVKNMTGKAGTRPVVLNAKVVNAGPEAQVEVDILARSAVIDEALRQAFRPEIRSVLDKLALAGTAENLSVHLNRPAGFGQKYAWRLTTSIRDGEIEYAGFPYRIKQLSGELDYDSQTETLTLGNVQGVHGNAAVMMGKGTYRRPPANPASPLPGTPPYGLDLPIVAQGVALDGDLGAAFQPTLKNLWDDLQPGGTADFGVNIRWIPGREPDIRLPELRIADGRLRLKAFPYPIDAIAATLAYEPGQLAIIEFVGWHDVTRLTTQQSSFTLGPADEWLLTLRNLVADDLQLDGDFRNAVPAGLREVIETLDLQGAEGRSPIRKISGEVALRGARRSPQITAAWNLAAELANASARVGVQATGATGVVACAGHFDEKGAALTGNVNLASAEVFGKRLNSIHGPFALENGQVEVGTREALAGGPNAEADPPGVPIDRRLQANCLGNGLVTLDAIVNLQGRQPSYLGRTTLSGGGLQYLTRNSGEVSGVMNGWINFQGTGSDAAALAGRGRLRVEPAALYHLPVFMQMFQALMKFAPAWAIDNTAFRSAQADFRIRNGGFEAIQPDGAIVLAGDSLRLVGGGRIDFKGGLYLDFYTTPPRNAGRFIPVVGTLLNMAATGWVGVEVRGTTDQPVVQTVPLKALDDGWRQMLEALGPPPARTAGPLPGSRR